jgi:hypothetical protein
MRSAKYLCNNNNKRQVASERARSEQSYLTMPWPERYWLHTNFTTTRYKSLNDPVQLVRFATCFTHLHNATIHRTLANATRSDSDHKVVLKFESGGVAVVLHSASAIPRLQSRRNRFHDWPWACLWFRPSNALCYGSTNARFFLYESIAVVGLF